MDIGNPPIVRLIKEYSKAITPSTTNGISLGKDIRSITTSILRKSFYSRIGTDIKSIRPRKRSRASCRITPI